MNHFKLTVLTGGLGLIFAGSVFANHAVVPVADAPPLEIQGQSVRYVEDLDVLVFEQRLAGPPGEIVPELDGAPVLGYVFPTTRSPALAGFGEVEGILALAATSHPDFDDTPLWDEGMTGRYDDDGAVWHAHWVVLSEDERVPGGLSVVEFDDSGEVMLPPTNPGMDMYLDSPGFNIVVSENVLRLVVPAFRIRDEKSFRYDAVTAYMQVNTSDDSRPMLGVYKVYDIASDDLSLPYESEMD